jgi:hypothetical protein
MLIPASRKGRGGACSETARTWRAVVVHMTIQQILAWLCMPAFAAGAAITIWAFVRFSVIGAWRTPNASSRLGHPHLDEVSAEFGVSLPNVLDRFYRKDDRVRRSDFYMRPPGVESPQWYIACFISLTRIDINEWLAATGMPGIPLAIDGDKGTYYLPVDALRKDIPVPVLFREPGRAKRDVVVASSIEEVGRFQAQEAPELEWSHTSLDTSRQSE